MRKRDDPHEGYLYRVTAREVDSDEWFHTSYGHYGQPRTYMTLGAAKGMKTRMERANQAATESPYRHSQKFEFRVERAPVVGWEPIDG